MPRVVIGKCDVWLRKSAAKDERALVALSEPRESEMKKIDRMLRRGKQPRVALPGRGRSYGISSNVNQESK